MSTTAPVRGGGAGAGAGARVRARAAGAAGRLRPVFCVIEGLHHSRSVADDAVAGRFTCAGTTLDVGPDPDWTRDPLPSDEEWAIEWSKLYAGIDLAAACRETGDPRYLRTWERLVRSWVAQVPVGRDPSDVSGRRLQNWVYAWQGFVAAGLPPDPETVDVVVARMRADLTHLVEHLTPERNHRTLELYAVLVVALAVPELDPDGHLVDDAWAELGRNLLTDVRDDGVHRECSTHYHLIALRSFVGARENARRFGLPVPAGYDERLRLACRFALHVQRPDGTIPAVSDSDTGDYRDLLALASTLVDLPGLAWAATAGAVGDPPGETAVEFPVGGYAVQRSGWGDAGERFLLLDAGPIGDGGHGHYDALSIEAHAGGHALLVDPGRYTYAEGDPNWRRWFKGTAAHSTVTVDGLDQTPYRRGKPQRGTAATAALLPRHRSTGLDVLTGRVVSTAYDAVHTRQVAFVAGEYWVVLDTLAAPPGSPHTYAQRWHLAPAAQGRARVRPRSDDVVVSAPGLALVLPADADAAVEDGWIAPEYGVRQAAPVVVVTGAGAPDRRMVAALWPSADHDDDCDHDPVIAPQLRVTDDGRTVLVRLAGVGPGRTATDELVLASAPGTPDAPEPGWRRRQGGTS
jgi:hypothetical protein